MDPSVALNPDNVVADNSVAVFTCIITGNPAPFITWEKKDSGPLTEDNRINITHITTLDISVGLYTVIDNFSQAYNI